MRVGIIIILGLIATITLNAPEADLINMIPGYPPSYDTRVYSGFLDVKNPNRVLHYVFVESANGSNNKDPVTLWLSGGPGCSSLMGFLAQIGPYIVDETKSDSSKNLTQNKNSWHKISNLLFIQSPAGVGFSPNKDQSYINDDVSTSYDNLYALINFFAKYPQYTTHPFFIAGQQYAGKYIPDLAVLIDAYNNIGGAQKINLKGLFIGNGLMNVQTLELNQYQFMINRRFVDPDIIPFYKNGCQKDLKSAECNTFREKFLKNTRYFNTQDVYNYCYYNVSVAQRGKKNRQNHLTSEGILPNLLKLKRKGNVKSAIGGIGAYECYYEDSIKKYFNTNSIAYHSNQKWNGPCNYQIKYQIDPFGSIESYRYLLHQMDSARTPHILLYSGTVDSIIPFNDTLHNIKFLDLEPMMTHEPWFTEKQHSGFQQLYARKGTAQPRILFVTVKGASQRATVTKRAQIFNLFKSFISSSIASSEALQTQR